MHIAFIDLAKWDYTVNTPYLRPLGGSQSAMCYLAERLAERQHDVRLFNSTTCVSVSRGVTCAPLARISAETWRALDVVVVQNWAKAAVELRPHLRADARLILWTQHANDQPAMHALSNPVFRDAHDAFVFVSDWQRRRYEQVYGIDPRRSHVLRNAIGPAFESQFHSNEDVLGAKSQPPVLAYTSTPFRGLEVLLDVFPQIAAAVPGCQLRVYSSMLVYQATAARDVADFGYLYDRCRAMAGVEYLGSLPQPQLARELNKVSILAYPNTFAETSCITVMEAMASGCRVVTSALGALPETTAGFGSLVPVTGDWTAFRNQFTAATIDALRECSDDREATDRRLAQQIAFFNEHDTWRTRAREWETWLSANSSGLPTVRRLRQGLAEQSAGLT